MHRSRIANSVRSSILGLSALVAAQAANAADWLQWGGPNGDFTVASPKLAETWPEGGPKQLWKRAFGDGYSSVLVKGDRLFTMRRDGEKEIVVCLDAATGTTKWEHEYERTLWPDMTKQFGEGPNATPAIVDDRIVSIGVSGNVRCLELASGKLLWKHDLADEYPRQKRREEYGYSICPLIYRGLVLIAVGGDKHGVVAFKPADGSVAWASEATRVSYAQPLLTKLNGRDQYIYFSPTEVISLDPATGQILWRHPVVCDTENNLTPALRLDDAHVWAASQFRAGGGRLLKVSSQEGVFAATELWFTPKLQATHSTFVLLGDHVYGSIGGNDLSFFAAFNWKTGEIAWRQRGFHKALCIHADEKIIALDENGQLGLLKVSPTEMKTLAKAQVAEAIAWTAPTLVDTTLYVRDRKSLMAFDLGLGRQ